MDSANNGNIYVQRQLTPKSWMMLLLRGNRGRPTSDNRREANLDHCQPAMKSGPKLSSGNAWSTTYTLQGCDQKDDQQPTTLTPGKKINGGPTKETIFLLHVTACQLDWLAIRDNSWENRLRNAFSVLLTPAHGHPNVEDSFPSMSQSTGIKRGKDYLSQSIDVAAADVFNVGMQGFRHFHPLRKRRFISVVLLLVIALCGIIFSVPKTVVKDRSTPFPCMDCACSCSNSTSCWNKCCCMSDAQKLTWAENHHVTPPAWFLTRFAAGNKPSTIVETEDGPATKSCPLCRAAKSAQTVCAGSNAVNTVQAEVPVKVTVKVLAITDRNCNGLNSLFALVSLAMACKFIASWRPEIDVTLAVDSSIDLDSGVAFPPPTPPPQCCAS